MTRSTIELDDSPTFQMERRSPKSRPKRGGEAVITCDGGGGFQPFFFKSFIAS